VRLSLRLQVVSNNTNVAAGRFWDAPATSRHPCPTPDNELVDLHFSKYSAHCLTKMQLDTMQDAALGAAASSFAAAVTAAAAALPVAAQQLVAQGDSTSAALVAQQAADAAAATVAAMQCTVQHLAGLHEPAARLPAAAMVPPSGA